MLLLLLIVLTAIAGKIGIGLLIAGLVVLGIGLVAGIRGQARWASILTRRLGFAVAGAGLAAFVVGAVVSPAAPASTAAHTSAQSPQASGTSPRTTAAQPRGVAVLPATTTPAVTTTTTPPPPPPVPQLAMTCPAGGAVASPVFGQQISATAPYSVRIDYGDGDHYTNDDQHLGAIFSHTYHQSGSFVVNAVLTDATGQTATSSCTYNWTKPVAVTGGSSSGGSSSGSSGGSGTSGDTYTNVDGNKVPGPVSAPAAPPGATAQCNDGTWSFSQHHQGTCSSHGGVARWLG